MRWIRIIFLILFFLELSYTQEKYFVYFVDKGPSENQLLKTTPESLGISHEAVLRRQKVLSSDNDILTQADLPVFADYILTLENFGFKIIHKIKWMNAVSVTVKDISILKTVENLPFVEMIEPVRKIRFKSIDDKKSVNNFYLYQTMKQLIITVHRFFNISFQIFPRFTMKV